MQPLTCKKLMDSKKFQLMSVCSCRAGHGSIHFGNVPGIRQLYTHFSELSSFDLTLSQTSPCFHLSAIMSIEKIEGKGEIAHNEQFLLFPKCFFYLLEELSAIFIKFKIVVCKLFQSGGV